MEDDIPKLAEQGLRLVEMGIESGSKKQLDFLNKNATVADNLKAIRILQKSSIAIGLDFIMFYPDQEVSEIRDNLIFILKARLTQQEVFDHYLNLLILYPGTPLRAQKERELNVEFDHDDLPDSESLIKDEKVRHIYRLFIHDFVEHHLARLHRAITGLQAKIVNLTKQGASAEFTAPFRLQLVLLRHIPFKVLWYLTEAVDFSSLEIAVPPYQSYIRAIEQIERTLTPFKNETPITQHKKAVEGGYVG